MPHGRLVAVAIAVLEQLSGQTLERAAFSAWTHGPQIVQHVRQAFPAAGGRSMEDRRTTIAKASGHIPAEGQVSAIVSEVAVAYRAKVTDGKLSTEVGGAPGSRRDAAIAIGRDRDIARLVAEATPAGANVGTLDDPEAIKVRAAVRDLELGKLGAQVTSLLVGSKLGDVPSGANALPMEAQAVWENALSLRARVRTARVVSIMEGRRVGEGEGGGRRAEGRRGEGAGAPAWGRRQGARGERGRHGARRPRCGRGAWVDRRHLPSSAPCPATLSLCSLLGWEGP